jgi:hypothetical protein
MVKLSRITFTSLTLFAAFLLLFDVARGFRSADLAGDAPLCALNLEGLSAIERLRGQPLSNRDNILYIRFMQIGVMSSLPGIPNTVEGGSDDAG